VVSIGSIAEIKILWEFFYKYLHNSDSSALSLLSIKPGRFGFQEWRSFYVKAPGDAYGVYPEHNLFIQSMKLKNTLRHIMGEGLITHLGLDYYGE
jgi:hypothetical protein